jgi:hypothetical protein
VSYAIIGEIAGKARTGAALGLMITINAGCATLGTPIFGSSSIAPDRMQ